MLMFFIQDNNVTVDTDSSYTEFNETITSDKRSSTLDPGNIKMTFNYVSLIY